MNTSKTRKNNKILIETIKLILVQHSSKNEWKQVIMFKRHNNNYMEHETSGFINIEYAFF
jgi:hypothetical protein